MRARVITSLLAAAFVAASGVTTASATPVDATTEGLSATGARAFSELSGCTAGSDTLLVDLVVDESGSLKSTDPGAARVGGVLTALDALQDLSQQGSGRLQVQVALSTFAESYETLVPLAPLDDAQAERLRGATVEQLPGRQNGQWTDYRQALRGAQQTLADVPGDPCRVALWFTDGGLDVGDDTATALADLCSPRGLLDSVRSSGLTVIALALFTETGRGSVTPDQREQLRAVVEGSSSDAATSCGAAPIPTDSAAGAYLRADDAGSVSRLFAGAGALIAGGTPAGSSDCTADPCPEGRSPVVVDPGVAGVRLVVEGPGVVGARAVAPDSQAVDLAGGSTEVPGGTVDVSAREGLAVATFRFDAPDGSQVGEWSVAGYDATGALVPSRTDVFYFWGTELAISADALVVGEGGQVQLRLTAGGEVVDPALYRDVDLGVRVADGVSEPRPQGDGYVANVDLTDATADSVVGVSATASAVTRSGISLGPVSGRAQLPTSLPPSYPSVTPARLELPPLVGTGESTATLTVRGSDQGDSRVCGTPFGFTGPDAAADDWRASAGDCVVVPAGTEVTIPVTVEAGTAADGVLAGQVGLTLSDTEGGPDRELLVPVSMTMTRPVDEPLRWLWLTGLLLVALAIPLALVYVSNALVARFAVRQGWRVAIVPVTLMQSGISRLDGSTPLLVPDDFTWYPGSTRVRPATFSAGGAHWARRLPVWPLREASARVCADGDAVVLSNQGSYTSPDGRSAPAEFGLSTSWVLLVDPSGVTDTSAPAHLVLLNEDGGQLRRVIDERARALREFSGWREMWEVLQSVVERRTASAVATTPPAAAPSVPRQGDAAQLSRVEPQHAPSPFVTAVPGDGPAGTSGVPPNPFGTSRATSGPVAHTGPPAPFAARPQAGPGRPQASSPGTDRPDSDRPSSPFR